jgi:hypothetical protein
LSVVSIYCCFYEASALLLLLLLLLCRSVLAMRRRKPPNPYTLAWLSQPRKEQHHQQQQQQQQQHGVGDVPMQRRGSYELQLTSSAAAVRTSSPQWGQLLGAVMSMQQDLDVLVLQVRCVYMACAVIVSSASAEQELRVSLEHLQQPYTCSCMSK